MKIPTTDTGMSSVYRLVVASSVTPVDPGVDGIIITIAMMIWKKNDSAIEGGYPSPIRMMDATMNSHIQKAKVQIPPKRSPLRAVWVKRVIQEKKLLISGPISSPIFFIFWDGYRLAIQSMIRSRI